MLVGFMGCYKLERWLISRLVGRVVIKFPHHFAVYISQIESNGMCCFDQSFIIFMTCYFILLNCVDEI